MILCDWQIEGARKNGAIVIDPFDPQALQVNSYDVHLGKNLLWTDGPLDCRVLPFMERQVIPAEGIYLIPKRLYLGVTEEYTETHAHVPYLDGKSSAGRLGISIHVTAGRGDIGFCGHWTMELTAVVPVKVYAGMPIGQIAFHESGEPVQRYGVASKANYNDRGRSPDPWPVPSRMMKNFGGEK